ncbi:MAG: ComEA family DNA-binding protein [bacterium]
MWGFSKLQQRAVLFLLATFGAGCVILMYRRQQQPPPAAPALVAQFERFVRKPDSHKVEGTTPAPAAIPLRQEQATTRRLNINRASAVELTALPGIGPVMAQRIVDYRERHGKFRRLEDLNQVHGLGKRKLAALKELVVIE